jgi:N utilization substance protein B
VPKQTDDKSPGQTKPANKRGAARLAAVQALYQMDIIGTGVMETVAEYESVRLGKEIDGDTYLAADASWFRGVVAGVVEQQKQIDPIIHASLSDDWPLARIESILRAILRAGVFELSNRKDVPAKVVISEYVDIAHAFFEGDEPKMVNGVLDRVSRQLRDGELPDPSGPKTDSEE